MFDHIDSILVNSIKKAGISGKVFSSRIILRFEEVAKKFLSSDLADKIKPLYYKDGTIVVASLSPLAVEHLILNEEEIIAELNYELQSSAISNIQYLT